MHRPAARAAGALLALAAASSPARAALYEPAGNKVLLGVWVDTSFHDTPYLYNSRVGANMSAFQVAQQIPLPPYNWVTGAGGPAPAYQVLQTSTSAYIAITVYPSSFNIQPSDYQQLGSQILNYTLNYNRSVFLRFAPEMQGQWFPYGFQPSAYLQMWRTMYTTIKAIVPGVAIVWAPNTGQSYPYGQTTTNPADFTLLDTNRDGLINAEDDAFSPYFPGDDYVDWIGMSVYWKGPNYRNINAVQNAGFCGQALDNILPNGQQAGPSNFYQTYCANKPTKACMYAESGAAFHVNESTTGVSQLALQDGWMTGCTFNLTFYDTYPRIKMFMQFEHAKTEYDGGVADYRDYRVTNDTQLLSVYQAHLATAAPRFDLATPTTLPIGVESTGRPAALPGGSANSTTKTGLVFQTARIFDIGAPSLFANTTVAAAQRAAQAVTITVTSSLVGAVTWAITRRHPL